jgi:CRP-like cAMP-binding protein
MILVNIEKLQEGMILADALSCRGQVLFPKGAVLNEKRITQIRKYRDITGVWIDNSSEQKRIIAKNSPNSVRAMKKFFLCPGQYICIQGEKADCLYILVSGELNVIYTDETRFPPKADALEKLPVIEKHGKIVSSIKGKMNSFGELGVILGENRSATLQAVSDSIIAQIPVGTEGFSKTLISTPHLGMNIAVNTVKRLKDVYSKISGYHELITHAESVLQEYSAVYMELADSIFRKSQETKDYNLCCVHDRIKLSPLYKTDRKPRKYEPEDTCISRKTGTDIQDEDIFSHGQILEVKAGYEILSPGENSNRMYVLAYGNVGVFHGEKLVATYNSRGDLIGAVNILFAHAVKQKDIEQRTATVKALSDSQVLVIASSEFDSLVKTAPALVLHITRTMAEKLKDSLSEYSETRKNVEIIIERFAGSENSCVEEIKKVISVFMKKPDSAYECSAELKVLHKLSGMLQDKYKELRALFL